MGMLREGNTYTSILYSNLIKNVFYLYTQDAICAIEFKYPQLITVEILQSSVAQRAAEKDGNLELIFNKYLTLKLNSAPRNRSY